MLGLKSSPANLRAMVSATVVTGSLPSLSLPGLTVGELAPYLLIRETFGRYFLLCLSTAKARISPTRSSSTKLTGARP